MNTDHARHTDQTRIHIENDELRITKYITLTDARLVATSPWHPELTSELYRTPEGGYFLVSTLLPRRGSPRRSLGSLNRPDRLPEWIQYAMRASDDV